MNELTPISMAQNYTDLGALKALKQQARQDQREALRPVAEQFEALFIQQVLKEARKVKFDEGWLDGQSGDFYKDWFDKQLAQDLAAKGSLGFADNIVEQLVPHIASSSAKEHNDNQSLGKQTAADFSSTQAVLSNRSLKGS